MKKIIHVLHISKPAIQVYEAIATAKGLSNWWSTQVVSEEKVGGIVDFTFRGDFNPDMKITAMTPSKEVGWECVAGHAKWQDNEFTFELSEQNGATQLKFTQLYAKELSDEDYGIYNFNWGYYLHSLKEYCETGQGKPFEP
jgi:uncharacterized protein YndB with AHSA1/START domain